MKCAWFGNCAHLQDFSFFVYSLINCITGEFLGDVDRKLAAPPAQAAVPWKCHCGALWLHFLDRRAEVGCSSLLKVMHSPFSLLFVVLLLLSLVWGSWELYEKLYCTEHTWLNGLAKVRAWDVLFSPSTPPLHCCLEHLQSCPGQSCATTHSWGKLLDFTPMFHPWYFSHAANCPPAVFQGYKHSDRVCPEGGGPLCLVLSSDLALGVPHRLPILLRPLFCNMLGVCLNLFYHLVFSMLKTQDIVAISTFLQAASE